MPIFPRARLGMAVAILAGLTASSYHGVARAGGFWLAERGARSFSLGGAHIAGADDMNAQWLNPAGLTRLKGNWNLYLDAALIVAEQSFARAYDAEVARRDPAYADGFPVERGVVEPFFDPSLGVATRFGLEDWIFALGVYGPYAGTNKWSADGPQRYALVSLEPIQLTTQLSVGWRPHPRLAVGVGLQAVYTSIRQRVVISAYPGVFGWQEDRELDVFAEVAASDGFSPSGNAGIIWTPVDGLDVAVSAQLPVRADLAGKLRVNLPEHWYFSGSSVSGDRILGRVDFPGVVRLGVRAYEEESWSLELAAVAELWSAQASIPVVPQGIEFRDVPGIGTFRVKPIDIRQDFRDLVSVRVGGSWQPGGGALTLRAGTYVETGAAPDATVSVLRIDGTKLGFGFGATWVAAPLAIDLGLGYVHMFTREVTTSEKTQVNPLYDADEAPFGESGPNVIGNGRYEMGHWVMSVTASAGW